LCKNCGSGRAVLQMVSVCVFSLRYPACNAHAPYCHLWPPRLYCIFPHYLTNGMIFEKKTIEYKMCILTFCTTFDGNICHSKIKERDMIKNVYLSSCEVPGFSCHYFYYRYSALGPVWAEARAQSGDWYSFGTLHPGQVLRGSLPLLSPCHILVVCHCFPPVIF